MTPPSLSAGAVVGLGELRNVGGAHAHRESKDHGRDDRVPSGDGFVRETRHGARPGAYGKMRHVANRRSSPRSLQFLPGEGGSNDWIAVSVEPAMRAWPCSKTGTIRRPGP